MNGQPGHARLVAHDAAARAGTAGIDSQHGHPVARIGQVDAQRLDKGGFAHPRHAGQAHPDALPGVRRDFREELLGLRLMIGARGLAEGDGAGQRAAAACQEGGGEGMGGHAPNHRESPTSAAGPGVGWAVYAPAGCGFMTEKTAPNGSASTAMRPNSMSKGATNT